MRKLIDFDEDTFDKLKQLSRDRMATVQELADEAFADLLKKHGIPVDLKDALRKSASLAKTVAPGPKKKEEPSPRFVVKSKPVAPDKLKQAQLSAKEIDRLVAENYVKHKIEPNPQTTDEQFVRRVYLDITGTIPTYQQAMAFISQKDPLKRSKLIDELLSSDGYASHSFNYWADVLRYTDTLNGNVRGEPYRQWIKQSLAESKPWL